MHCKNHTLENPFAGLLCNEHFSLKGDLEKHGIAHSGVERTTRLMCNDSVQNVDLVEHLNIISPKIEKPFICHVCEESFSQESLLRNHATIHATDFLCKRNVLNVIEQRKFCHSDPHMPCRTDEVSIVPNVGNMICSASSGDCVIHLKVEDGGGQFGHVNTDEPSVSLIGNSNQKSELFPSSPDVPVPSGSNDNRVMCNGNCLVDVKDELVDIDMHAGHSSVSEGSLKVEDEADSLKLYGCGICCQSFSTKEETMHCFNSH